MIDWQTQQRFGGRAAIQRRVVEFREAVEAHRLTVDVPAPTEDPLIEQIARSDDTEYEAEPPPAPPVRRTVAKGLIVERLIAAGKIEAARSALATLSVADQERWNAKPAVYADDTRALALLRAIGADPAVILA